MGGLYRDGFEGLPTRILGNGKTVCSMGTRPIRPAIPGQRKRAPWLHGAAWLRPALPRGRHSLAASIPRVEPWPKWLQDAGLWKEARQPATVPPSTRRPSGPRDAPKWSGRHSGQETSGCGVAEQTQSNCHACRGRGKRRMRPGTMVDPGRLSGFGPLQPEAVREARPAGAMVALNEGLSEIQEARAAGT